MRAGCGLGARLAVGVLLAAALAGCGKGSPTHSIEGTVDGAVQAGVTLTLTPGGAAATTDGAGHFVLSGLKDGTYQLTPSRAGYLFSPSVRTVVVAGAGASGQDFTATAVNLTWDATAGWDQALWQ